MKIFLISIITKIIFKFTKTFKLGNGYTFSGYLILRLFPDILKNKCFNYKKGIILVSGTNGKTTTTKLISDVLKENNYKVVHNSSGSNLLRGIVTTLLLDLNLFAKPKSDVAVIEIDELNLPLLLTYIEPKALVLLNLSRDQLDRYGEIDNILIRWIDSVKKLSKKTTVILNSTQPVLLPLKNTSNAPILEFNEFLLKGLHTNEFYNIPNINACIKVCELFNIGFDKYKGVINNFENAYGRGEQIKINNTSFKIYLAKNPASFNANLQVLNDYKNIDGVCFILNDNLPDGKDVSWIYDIDNQLLKTFKDMHNLKDENIYICGSRCYDMAVRLKSVGYDILNDNVFFEIKKYIESVNLKDAQNIVVIPNYSAMLQFRKITLGKDILWN